MQSDASPTPLEFFQMIGCPPSTNDGDMQPMDIATLENDLENRNSVPVYDILANSDRHTSPWTSGNESISRGANELPEYTRQYGQITNAIAHLIPVISKLRNMIVQQKMTTNFELEARLGTIITHGNGRSKFVSGVTQKFMDEILFRVQQFENWTSVSDWAETHDFFYTLPNGKYVRSTVAFNEDHNTLEKKHIVKTVVDQKDFKYTLLDANNADYLTNAQMYDVRISISKEEDVFENELEPTIRPEQVRIKQRKSFCYASPEKNAPTWSFDFTFVWTGTSKADAEQNQKTTPPIYEVECECIDLLNYLSLENHDDCYVATSLLLKMVDFLGKDKSFYLNPVS